MTFNQTGGMSDNALALLDDTLQPLKRNHACLQCKKRKVKCDATKPTCSPCLRSHAHAIRAATRNNTSIPILTCSYTEEPDSPPDEDRVFEETQTAPMKKRVHPAPGFGSLGNGKKGLERERERRKEEERDTLLARIAELEAKISGMTPSTSDSSSSSGNGPQHGIFGEYVDTSSSSRPSMSTLPTTHSSIIQEVPDISWSGGNQPLPSTGLDGMDGTNGADYDFAELFMVPANWPRNLPSPFLLEHLLETFFTHCPQIPRIIHRARFMSHVHLPPTSDNFPHAALLHAMCAAAASHTAWVNNLPPEALEAAIARHEQNGESMETIEDFGLAQADAAQRAMRQAMQLCQFGPGQGLVEILQATIILSDLYFVKGLPLQAWMISGQPARLIKPLELTNKNIPKRLKEPLLPDSCDRVEREERIAAVWMAFIIDSGYSMNSTWSQSMDLSEIWCHLPTSAADFASRDEMMVENPQTAHSPDVFAHHPIPDGFVLTCKAAILVSKTAKWVRLWNQRDIVDGDEMTGMQTAGFNQIVSDIYTFQAGMPGVLKNVFRILDTKSSAASAFDANLLMVNVLPNVALIMAYEQFVDWKGPDSFQIEATQKASEAIIGLLHLIPSNLDIGLVMTSVLAGSMYSVGRVMANLVQRALDMQQYAQAVKLRADLSTLQCLMQRYGQKHALGNLMSNFIDNYIRLAGARVMTQMEMCGRITRPSITLPPQNQNQSDTSNLLIPDFPSSIIPPDPHAELLMNMNGQNFSPPLQYSQSGSGSGTGPNSEKAITPGDGWNMDIMGGMGEAEREMISSKRWTGLGDMPAMIVGDLVGGLRDEMGMGINGMNVEGVVGEWGRWE